MKKRYILTPLLITLLAAPGCKDEFLETPDPNNLGASSLYVDTDNANLALTGVYAPLKDIDLWGDQIHFFLHQITDEYDLVWKGDAGWNEIKQFSVSSENATLRSAWYGVAKMVLRSNDVIENVEKMKVPEQITQQNKEYILGQAYFIRAFAHFLGVNIWGQQPVIVDGAAPGFPVVTGTPVNRDQMYVKRAPVSEVYAQVIADLRTAEGLLPVAWTGNGLGRVTKGAATAYLGKVYLYQQNWEGAAAKFEEVIGNPAYSLLPNYGDNFNGKAENSPESIFEVQFSDKSPMMSWDGGPGHAYATRHAPDPLGWGNVSLSPATVTQFGTDPRLRHTAFIPGKDSVKMGDNANWQPYKNTNGTGYSPKKFIRADRSAVNTGPGLFNNEINMPLMRLADVYLMYAEAQLERGNATVALEYVNKVRRRAYGLSPGTPSPEADRTVAGAAELRQAIRDERFLELCGEGHRWFDLLRWGVADDLLTPRGFTPGIHQAMPIPTNEIQLNPAMTQNNGY